MRILDENIFKEITDNTNNNKIELSQEDTEYLYEKAKEEIEELYSVSATYKHFLSETFFGEDFLRCEGVQDFFNVVYFYHSEILLPVLEGDVDKLLKAFPEFNINEFDNIRNQVYQALINKYL